ncbi:hypothetical protein L0156_20330 [bacterium]|nr:hypothetical protein [bacterium]
MKFKFDPEEFWREKTLEELADEQGVGPFQWEEVFGKGADLWEDDDDFEKFVNELRQLRKEGK